MNATEMVVRAANPVPDVAAPPADAIDAAAVLARLEHELETRPSRLHTPRRLPPGWWMAAAAAAVVVLLIGAVALLNGQTADVVASNDGADPSASPDTRFSQPGGIQDPSPITDRPVTTGAVAARPAVTPLDARQAPRPGTAVATAGTPPPDVANAELADDGGPPAPPGTIDVPPNPDRLDFHFESCDAADACVRDAQFVDPDDPLMGAGPWPAGRPFHVRHGFPAEGPDPLGDGFDVAVYVFSLTAPGELGGGVVGPTMRYTTDYVMREESTACGPTYRIQTEPVTCEVFVHEFPDGLPAGRWALWAVWEAPCRAWVDYGLIESCTDPDEVMALFSSGVDSPFVPGVDPEYLPFDQGPRARDN